MKLLGRLRLWCGLLVCCLVFKVGKSLDCEVAQHTRDESVKNALRECLGIGKEPPPTTPTPIIVTSNSTGNNVTSTTSNATAASSSPSNSNGTAEETTISSTSKISENSPEPSPTNQSVIIKRSAEMDDKKNETTEMCIPQCLLQFMGMINDKGYPDRILVAQGLLRGATGRELKDFFQDSTNECFQMMDQGDKSDTCVYSTGLLVCLAEKGRANCGDWDIYDLPFITKTSQN